MQEKLKQLRTEYPSGTRVKLVKMDDEQAPPIGSLGTVIGVDDLCSILVRWDNGSRLSIVLDVDKCVKVQDDIIRQIIKVRDTGLTNMFDTNSVQRIAYEMGLYELVMFIEDDKKAYINIIINGKK
ncbi:TPA: DUF4314 domain-containing protein [Streptococcus suis]|uniref:DUF4314 domain-containing protein n=1 Tax=Streptococcus porci TaxID=502567 RepID=UPI000401AA07|nr:DUF4314 domain-containing protein [Streptococcus porci]NQK84088.1 DUF4314 domain-containing protein [Streptococcus suis]HEL1597977.1 DUF4314 domain-containing protein [Streptococcus suis]HEL1599825.1 DUF4314 domain-containing protein [Streptococcus suis]HEL1761090.1 DUF4314 domain-containing protein [Streptococcus suis]HEL9645052.1 DUF4314 domain-containing protein [Streptococcus suis]